MKKLLYLTFLLAFSIPGFSQKNSLLYSIKKEGMKTSYLFGTIHLIADSAFYFPAKLEKTLAKADELVLEIGNITDHEKALTIMHLDSGSVFDLFTPAQTDSLVTWGAQALRMSPEAFRKGFAGMKPFALMQINLQTMIKGPVRSYEFELIGKANANKQSVSGLETMEYQLALFENLPDETLREMILDGMRHPEESLETNRKMTELYVKQDLEELTQLIIESEELSSNVETFIFQRNHNWIPKMTSLMTNRSCFFAVGAGHLGGEHGVIQLLKNAGYAVTPISY